MRTFRVVGGEHQRGDALGKVTGKARYAADLSLRGMLHAVAVHARRPHAEVEELDASNAMDVPGVVAVLTAADVPGKKRFGTVVKDQPVLAERRVRFVGDAVAVVVARTREAAEEGGACVSVRYRDVSVVSDPSKALRRGAPSIHRRGNLAAHHEVRRGDADEALAGADVSLERSYETQFVEHAYLEPEAVVAEPLDNGGVRVTGCVQNIFTTRRDLCRVLDLPMARVEVRQPAFGGTFGGKDEVMTAMSCRAALAALRTGKPVKMVNTREDSFLESYKRHPYRLSYRIGCDANGMFSGLIANVLADAGAYAAMSPFVTWRSAVHATGPYRFPHVKIDVTAAYTNNVYTSAMRGFGSPQICFAVESIVDELAERVGTNPLELRLQNVLRKGDTTATGQPLTHVVSLSEVLRKVTQASGYVDGWYRCARERSSKPRAKGFGLACSFRGVSLGAEGVDAAGTIVSVQSDGSVIMSSGLCDFGQGSQTTMAVIIAEILAVPLEQIAFLPIDTARVPDSGPTVASRTTVMGGGAARNAAYELRRRLLRVVAQDRGLTPRRLDLRDGHVVMRDGGVLMSFGEAAALCHRKGVPLLAAGWYKAPETTWHPECGQGDAYFTYVYGANVAEVEVDRGTGKVWVRRFFSCHDVGRAISLSGVRGQVYGGVAMGMGYALWEDFRCRNAQPQQENLDGYFLPTSLDVPVPEVQIVEHPDPAGPFGAKSIAEPATEIAAPAIANAVANATGKRFYRLPLTMEEVLIGRRLSP